MKLFMILLIPLLMQLHFSSNHDSTSGRSFLSPMAQFQLLINSSSGHDSIIQPMNAFFEEFFAKNDSVDDDQWELALPTDSEREQMKKLIAFLMSIDDFGQVASDVSLLSRIAPLLVKSIRLTFIKDQFCVIHELLPSLRSDRFRRFWGYMVLCASFYCNSSRAQLHHSSPHFQTDGDVCNQSAAIFERTSSRSLVVAGATRFSIRGNLTSSCQPKNAKADAAHNNLTMFHTMCVGLFQASKNDIFMQWHGQRSCPQSGAFISAGANGLNPIYTDTGAYVNKFVTNVNKLAGKNIATTPMQDRKCALVASKNVFGRIVNGVPADQSCKKLTNPKNVKGKFIHIEQQQKWLDDWNLWTEAVNQL